MLKITYNKIIKYIKRISTNCCTHYAGERYILCFPQLGGHITYAIPLILCCQCDNLTYVGHPFFKFIAELILRYCWDGTLGRADLIISRNDKHQWVVGPEEEVENFQKTLDE